MCQQHVGKRLHAYLAGAIAHKDGLPVLAQHAPMTTNVMYFCTPVAPAMHECLLCHSYLLTLQHLCDAADFFAREHVRGAEHTYVHV